MFKASRGMCAYAALSWSLSLGRPQPHPPAVSLQLLFMVKAFLKMARSSTIGIVTPSCCPSGCQEPLADSQLSISQQVAPWTLQKSHLLVVYGKVTETPAFILDSGKSVPGQYSGGLYSFAQTATIMYHWLVGLNHRNSISHSSESWKSKI